ncbi:MAG TPA: universal stress protein [Polyangia bacterium]
MPLGNILVGVDFSESGRDAAARAATLPVGRGSSITLAHALPPRLPARLAVTLEAAAHKKLEAAKDALSTALAAAQRRDVDVFGSVAVGSPVDVLDALARDGRAELIVVGRGLGRTAGLRDARLGSVAAQIARASDRSVLVVATLAERPYIRPLAAIDLSELSRGVVEATVRLCPDALEVGVVHAFLPRASADLVRAMRDSGLGEGDIQAWTRATEEQARAAAAAELNGLPTPGVTLELFVREGDARDAIVAEAERHRADLVAVATRGHSKLRGWLFGSVADHVLRSAPCDVLVVR